MNGRLKERGRRERDGGRNAPQRQPSLLLVVIGIPGICLGLLVYDAIAPSSSCSTRQHAQREEDGEIVVDVIEIQKWVCTGESCPVVA